MSKRHECETCGREFRGPHSLAQHCAAKKHCARIFMSPADAAEMFDDGEGYAGLAMAMEAAGYEPGDVADFLMAVAGEET